MRAYIVKKKWHIADKRRRYDNKVTNDDNKYNAYINSMETKHPNDQKITNEIECCITHNKNQ